ncbi:hypothetical protein ACHAWF_006900 [Thalassiosira exigua]
MSNRRTKKSSRPRTASGALLVVLVAAIYLSSSSKMHSAEVSSDGSRDAAKGERRRSLLQTTADLDAYEEVAPSVERALSKNHHHKHAHEPIDYAAFPCDELRTVQSKHPKRFDRCEFAKRCDDGDGIMFPSLFCDEDDGSYRNHVALLVFLSLALLLLFRLLGSTTDEFFSPGLEMFSLKLGLPPRFAGVTLLALGNGAPDVAATMNAVLQNEATGYEMALGELTGTTMFVTSVILGVVVNLSGSDARDEKMDGVAGGDGKRRPRGGVPCRGPLLRDIAVLILVCAVSLSYLKIGVIDHGFVYTMLGMYCAYVLLVLGADAYHVFYHVPSLVRATASGSDSSVFSVKDEEECRELGGDQKSAGDVGGSTSDGENEEEGGVAAAAADEQTPLTSSCKPYSRSESAPQHHQHRSQRGHDRHHRNFARLCHHNSLPAHAHSLGGTVIEAMSNYSCNEEPPTSAAPSREDGSSSDTTDPTPSSPGNDSPLTKLAAAHSDGSKREGTASPGGWAALEEDGTEPLVIFHPHHAVHPHHGQGGLLFLRSASHGSSTPMPHYPTAGDGHRQHSWSVGDDKSGGRRDLKKSSSCDASSLRASPSGRTPSAAPSHPPSKTMQITTMASSGIDTVGNPDEMREERSGDDANGRVRPTMSRPDGWSEAWASNYREFVEHWRDFYADIYRNDENSVLDVIFLSVELPFTIARKLTNPVPCDGYYCRPLVAVSLSLSPLWLRYYFSDQFEVNIFASSIGRIASAVAVTMGLVVMRYAPDGDGPMEFCMVVPLTLYGFAIAATWLDAIADALVDLLDLFGIMLNIPSTIMGLVSNSLVPWPLL